ncbi:PQQ-binding-like beta-propeller repeat protein, partial [Candidatus Woesearchaeota archaeon]|nr:PQQ-binding-like beta-propeller repeat protein [Candidatus Woesearchaeota archaeon]
MTQQALGDKLVAPNVSFADYMDIFKDYVNGFLLEYAVAIWDSGWKMRIDKIATYGKMGKTILFNAQSVGSIPHSRKQMFGLASYYIAKEGDIYFQYDQSPWGLAPPWDPSNWFNAITYDIGQPVGPYYEIDTGIDPAPPVKGGEQYVPFTYYVYARKYTKGLVVIKPRCHWAIDYTTDLSTPLQLDGNYYVLNYDGTLLDNDGDGNPDIVTMVNLRQSEGVILLDANIPPSKPYPHINTFLWANRGTTTQTDVQWWGENYDVILREYTLPGFNPEWEKGILKGINPDVAYFASKAELEADPNYVLREKWLSQSNINESTFNEVINEAASGKKQVLFGESPFWGCYIDKEIMTLLARYYIVKGENLFFGAKNGDLESENSPAVLFESLQWLDAISYDIGQPEGSYYEWSANPKVWARNYDKALILVKIQGNYGTTTHSLGGSYYQLHRDGVLTGPITEITLDDGEGTVLIRRDKVNGVWIIPPTGFKVIPGNGKVNFSWNPRPEPERAGYNIYRTTNLDGTGYTKINTSLITQTSYQDISCKEQEIYTGLTNGQPYLYRITAQTIDGIESAFSYNDKTYIFPTDASPFVEKNGRLEIEAENAHIVFGSFTTSQEASIVYMWVPEKKRIPGQGDPMYLASCLDYLIEIQNPGDYILVGNIRGDGGGGDSFLISMDVSSADIKNLGNVNSIHTLSPGKIEGDWHPDVDSCFKWIKAFDWSYNLDVGKFIWDCGSPHSDPLIFHLDAGKHLFRIRLAEDGTKIDKFVLTQDMPPSAPKNLRVIKSTASTVELAWEKNTENDLAGYNIFRFDMDNAWTWAFPPDKYRLNPSLIPKGVTTWQDTGLEKGKTYYYLIDAVDSSEFALCSGYSNDAQAITSGHSIWVKPTFGAVGRNITLFGDGYTKGETVKVDFGTSISMAVAADTGVFQVIFVVSSQTSGTRTITSSGLSSNLSDTCLFYISPDNTPPSNIGNLKAVQPTSYSIVLTWTAPSEDGGKAESYDIRYSYFPINDGNFDSISQCLNIPFPNEAGISESFEVGGLLSNTLYYFALKTTDKAGNISAISNTAQAKTIEGIPWPTFRQNLARTGQSPYPGPSIPQLKWKHSVSSVYDHSEVAIGADGTIYTLLATNDNNNNLYAIHPDGKDKWSYNPEGSYYYSHPSVGPDGSIYIGTHDPYFGLHCLNPDGGEKWKVPLNGFVCHTPTIDNKGHLYVGVSGDKVYSLSQENGSLIWEKYVVGWKRGSFAIGKEGVVYIVTTGGELCAISDDGRIKWSKKGLGEMWTSPAISPKGTIYIGSDDGRLYWFDREGKMSGSFTTGGKVRSSSAIDKENRVYFGSLDKNLYCLNPDGSLKWSYSTGGEIHSSPAIDSEGTIYFGSDDGYLYALYPDKSLKWKYEIGSVIRSSPALSNDGTIYIIARDDYLYALGTPCTYYHLTGSITTKEGS